MKAIARIVKQEQAARVADDHRAILLSMAYPLFSEKEINMSV